MNLFRDSFVSRVFNSLLVLFLVLCVLDAEGVKYFKIGGIFDEEHRDSEMAFRYGIDRINMHSHRIKFEPVVKIAGGSDSFRTEKMACSLLEEGVIGIFGPDSEDTRGIVESICTQYEIPHVEATWMSEPTVNDIYGMSLNFYPTQNELARAWAALVDDYDWKSYSILYEEEEGLIRLSEILKKHDPSSSPIATRQLDPEGDNRPIFKAIHNASEYRVIMDCKPENAVIYFRQAQEVKMMEDYQTYILTNIDAHTADMAEFKFRNTNVTTMRMIDPMRPSVRNAVSDWEEGEKMKERDDQILVRVDNIKLRAALMNDAVRHFAATVIELDKTKNITPPSLSCKDQDVRWEHGLGISSFMALKQSEGMTGRVEFADRNRKEFSVDILELAREGFKKIATWTATEGVKYSRSKTDVMATISEKWKNKTFIVASRKDPPYLIVKKPQEGEVLVGNNRYEGYAVDLIDAIANHLNLTYEFRLAPDNNYGGYNKDTKRWDGLIRELLENGADLAICDLTITSERKSAVDFTMPFMTLGISILFSKPVKEDPSLFSFLSPLSLDVWVFMGTAYIGVSLLMFVLSRIEPKNWESPRFDDDTPDVLVNVWQMINTFWFSWGSLMGVGCDILPKMAPNEWANPHPCVGEPEELENALNILNSMWFSMGSFLQQGSDILPRAVATRIVAGMWWFFTLIMISSYTANLAAFLTNTRSGTTIKSAEDLAKQTKVKYGAVKGGSTSKFFENSNFSTYKQMWAAMESTKPSVFVKNNPEGIDRVLKGKSMYAFIMESTAIEYIMERECDLTQIGGKLDSKGYGIAMPPNSPYRTAISGAVLKLQEEGKLHQLKTKWWKERLGGGVCKPEAVQTDDAELGMDNVGGVFLVLGCGCAMALIAAIMEFLWNVRAVAVDQKITFKDAFVAELKFAVNIWITTKPVQHDLSESNSSRSSSRSGSKSKDRSEEEKGSPGNALQAATSFMRLDKIF